MVGNMYSSFGWRVREEPTEKAAKKKGKQPEAADREREMAAKMEEMEKALAAANEKMRMAEIDREELRRLKKNLRKASMEGEDIPRSPKAGDHGKGGREEEGGTPPLFETLTLEDVQEEARKMREMKSKKSKRAQLEDTRNFLVEAERASVSFHPQLPHSVLSRAPAMRGWSYLANEIGEQIVRMESRIGHQYSGKLPALSTFPPNFP